ncbi:MAG: acyl carrier protein [Nitrospiraceae bacterium]|nr:MAG: acyl carrier protein [Nitrospiraceae bacterium]
MTESISREVFDILARHAELDPDKVTPSTLLQMSGVDSLLMVEIIFDLEEHFDITIPDELLGMQNQELETAADVVRLVEKLIQHKKTS